ncbi:MAG: glycosyltransferase, partial [Nostoc sp.]
LQAGLIPILSYESGVDVHDFGVIFDNLSLEEIKAKVRSISNLPVENLKLMSRQAWEYARANHTKEKFAQAYRNAVEQIIENHSQKKQTDSTASSKQLVSSDR